MQNNLTELISTDRSRVQKHGLDLVNITWDDNARCKDSCFGPCISDMTLVTDEMNMPVIRYPNTSDKTVDISIDRFKLTVGNETGESLSRVSLKDFLNGSKILNDISLLSDRDSHILVSAQYCILPLDKGKCSFHVCIHNYQSTSDDPAVLVIVASAEGTSVQTLTHGTDKLYFNDNGYKCDYQVQRQKDYLKENPEDAKDELKLQEHNVLFVYQIPLKQKEPSFNPYGFTYNIDNFMVDQPVYRSISLDTHRGMDNGYLTHGERKDKMGTLMSDLERDHRYPIRCTMQFYKVTDEPHIPDSILDEMVANLSSIYKLGISGSLVLSNDPTADTRVTAPRNLDNVTRFNNPMFDFFTT